MNGAFKPVSNRATLVWSSIELLAVMAIVAISAGLLAGSVVGLGNQGQQARLDGDQNGLQKAANRFSLEAFAQVSLY